MTFCVVVTFVVVNQTLRNRLQSRTNDVRQRDDVKRFRAFVVSTRPKKRQRMTFSAHHKQVWQFLSFARVSHERRSVGNPLQLLTPEVLQIFQGDATRIKICGYVHRNTPCPPVKHMSHIFPVSTKNLQIQSSRRSSSHERHGRLESSLIQTSTTL